MRQRRLLCMKKGEGTEVANVGVRCATCPRVDGSSNGVGGWSSLGCGAKCLAEKGKVVKGNCGDG